MIAVPAPKAPPAGALATRAARPAGATLPTAKEQAKADEKGNGKGKRSASGSPRSSKGGGKGGKPTHTNNMTPQEILQWLNNGQYQTKNQELGSTAAGFDMEDETLQLGSRGHPSSLPKGWS